MAHFIPLIFNSLHQFIAKLYHAIKMQGKLINLYFSFHVSVVKKNA